MHSRLYLSAALIFLFAFARAQPNASNSSTTKNDPAAVAILKQLPGLRSDTARVNAYLNLAETRWKSINDTTQKKEAFRWANRSLDLSEKIRWNEGKARSLFTLATLQAKARQLGKAEEYFRKAAALPVGKSLYYKIALGRSGMYMRSGQFLKAKEEVTKILPGLSASADTENQRQAYSMMGIISLLSGEAKQFLAYNLKVLDTYRPADTTSGHFTALKNAGQGYMVNEDLPHALESYQQAERLLQRNKRIQESMDGLIGDIYFSLGEYENALKMHRKALTAAIAKNDTRQELSLLTSLASDAHYLHQDELAVQLYEQALEVKGLQSKSFIFLGLARAYLAQKKYSLAINAVKQAQEEEAKEINDPRMILVSERNTTPDELGLLYLDAPGTALLNGGLDTAGRYRKAVEIFEHNLELTKKRKGFYQALVPAYQNLARAYERLHDDKRALATYRLYTETKDSVARMNNKNDVIRRRSEFSFARREDSLNYKQLLAANLLRSQIRLINQQKDIEALNNQRTQASLLAEQNRRQANEQKLKVTQKEQALAGVQLQLQKTEIGSRRSQSYYMMAGIGALLLLSVFIWRNYRNQRLANRRIIETNRELDRQRNEVTQQRDKLDGTIKELKATQQQLIQSEKMASLGELTAGIAHEIQNPLNFVNNFSEVTTELLQELKEEALAGNTADVLAIAADIEQNLGKINHHGKRADGIVKGMLQHSRSSAGQKELTDLNKLADEYLRLAYHGLRAKDKHFNVDLITNYDEKLLPLHVVPQDIGRVLLNLFNNAFYAVKQRQQAAEANYTPLVEVSTSRNSAEMKINVRDNGIGIPATIRDKIMQPFFTTKPTGQGTGLGLSLSYDIIVKGHGGTITLNNILQEGAEFSITLPS